MGISKSYIFYDCPTLHTYIHNWPLQPLATHTTYVVCVNSIHEWCNIQFKVEYERQNFWAILHGIRRRHPFFHFSFCWSILICGLNSSRTSNEPTHHLVNYENFTYAALYTCLFFKISLTNLFNLIKNTGCLPQAQSVWSLMPFAACEGTKLLLASGRNLIRHLIRVIIWVKSSYLQCNKNIFRWKISMCSTLWKTWLRQLAVFGFQIWPAL